MDYHVEDRSYPEFESRIIADFDMTNLELRCPKCNCLMAYVDGMSDEQYMPDGTMERFERFYCDDCGTFADITQVYQPTVRRVSVMQDVWED